METYKYVIGIDPGKQGAIAILDGENIVGLHKCPSISSHQDIIGMAKLIEPYANQSICYIEKVHAMPKQGVTSMFTFGKGYGAWLGILASYNIPYHEIDVKLWKGKLLKGMDKKEKQNSIIVAKRYFPEVDLKPGRKLKDDDNLAESILLAIYGMFDQLKGAI